MSGSFPVMAGAGLKRRDALKWIGGGTLGFSTLAGIAAGSEADQLNGATVFVGSDDGNLYAVDATTGEQVWVFEEPSDSIRSSPVVVDGIVYVGCDDGHLYAVDAATGELEWSYRHGAVVHTPSYAAGSVYVHAVEAGIGGAGSILALDAATGEVEWEHRDDGLGLHGRAPVVADGRIYTVIHTFGILSSSWVIAFDVETGEQLWKYKELFGDLTEPPIYHDGVVIVTGTETIVALDGETGDERWKEFFTPRLAGPRSTRGMTVFGDTIYHGVNDRLFARDAVTGERIPWFNLRLTDEEQFMLDEEVLTAPTVDCPSVFFGTDEAFYAADTLHGTIAWRNPDVTGHSSPTAFGSTVFVGGDGSSLYAIDATDGELEWVFDEPDESVHSSPTVVADPSSGHSVGSRFRNATLNHHDRTFEPTQPAFEIGSVEVLDPHQFPATGATIDVPAELGFEEPDGTVRVPADAADAFVQPDDVWLGLHVWNIGDVTGSGTVELHLDGEIVGELELEIDGCHRSIVRFGERADELYPDGELAESYTRNFVAIDDYRFTAKEFTAITSDDSRTIVVEIPPDPDGSSEESATDTADQTDEHATDEHATDEAIGDDRSSDGQSGSEESVIGSDLPGFGVASAVVGLATVAYGLFRRAGTGEEQ